jgi:hypothetical protein
MSKNYRKKKKTRKCKIKKKVSLSIKKNPVYLVV